MERYAVRWGSESYFPTSNSAANTVIATALNQSFRSTDRGATWKEIPQLRAIEVAFADSGLVLVGRLGGELSRSLDDGESWTEVKTDAEGGVSSIVFAGDTVFASANGGLLRSLDRGQTWRRSPASDVGFPGLDAAGGSVIAVGGAGLVVRSGDGGETWQERWLPGHQALRAVAFADRLTAVIVGSDGTILRSSDAGVSWNTVQSPTRAHLNGVAFANAMDGLAVGFWGEAIRTSDGGMSWVRERTGTRLHLMGVTAKPDRFLVSGTRELVLSATAEGVR